MSQWVTQSKLCSLYGDVFNQKLLEDYEVKEWFSCGVSQEEEEEEEKLDSMGDE